MSSGKVICFTDSRGNPLFSLPDSSFLCLEYGNGDSSCAFCRYHSEEQVEIDGPQRGTGGNRRKVQKYPPVCKADGEEWNPVSAHE